MTWFENTNGGTQFVAHSLGDAGSSTGAIKLVDLDGDGRQDIVVCSYGTDEVLQYRNLGGGLMGPKTVLTSAIDGPWALGHGDLDNDGDADLVIGSWLDDELYVMLFQGGTPQAPVVIATGVDGPSSLDPFDLDGDGDLDLLSASRNDSKLEWFENHGSLATFELHDIGTHSTAFEADAADLDDDGDLDVFVAASGSSNLAWHEGLGEGAFGLAQVIDAGASGVRFVHLDDLDGDDDFDVLSANYSGANVGYFQNLLPTKKPKIVSIDGLVCAGSGSAQVLGKNLLGTSAWVEGQPVPVANVTATRLDLVLGPDIPGGLRDVVLSNSFGATEWPDVLRRYPVIELPPAVPLGSPVEMVIDNGEPGAYVLAYSGALFPAPAPFASFGWYHGLELNGVWLLALGNFTATETSREVFLTAPTAPALVGTDFHLQAWTHQSQTLLSGFTDTMTVRITD